MDKDKEGKRKDNSLINKNKSKIKQKKDIKKEQSREPTLKKSRPFSPQQLDKGVTTESNLVKGVAKEGRTLDIGRRKTSVNYGGKRTSQDEKFKTIKEKESKLSHKKNDVADEKKTVTRNKKQKQIQRINKEKSVKEKPIKEEAKIKNNKDLVTNSKSENKNNVKKKINRKTRAKSNQSKLILAEKKLTTDNVNSIKSETSSIEKRKSTSKLYHKSKYKKTSMIAGGLANTTYIASEFLETGSDENVGIEGASKGLEFSSRVSRYSQSKLKSVRRNPLKEEKRVSRKKTKNNARQTYKKELKTLQSDGGYQKKSNYKKLQKRRQMKNKIYREKGVTTSFKERIKKGLDQAIKSTVELIKRNLGKILIVIGAIILAYLLLTQVATLVLGGLSGFTSQIASTTYLSNENVLEDINSDFTDFETQLIWELDNIAGIYPGYDEYHVSGKSEIGHDIHELLSYITAKHGEIKDVSSISGDLLDLFYKMYKVNYEVVVETRYRQVCYGEGEDYYCVNQAYNWYILSTSLEKKALDTVAREDFAGYEDNLSHYESLLETGGNMKDYFGD